MAEPVDPRRHSPAAERNQGPILTELLRRLPAQGHALELASGTGQHVVHFARAMPGWRWQPSDTDAEARASVAARRADAGLADIAEPIAIDLLAADPGWPVGPFDLVFCANLLHIAPWACCAALMRGAAACLATGGRVILYGPYRVAGEPLQPGNQAFDADLRARNPAWGLRWLHEVEAEAGAAGLALRERVAMPANNLLLVFSAAEPGPRHRVTSLGEGQVFDAAASRPLLDSALAAGLRLAHACRQGHCRTCLARLHQGEVAYVVDWPGLSAEERAAGWTLPCVALPRSDLQIELRITSAG